MKLKLHWSSMIICSLFPWLKYVIPKQCGYTNTKEANDAVAKIIEESLDKHLKTYDPGNKRDFTDVYISEMIKQKDNPGQCTFTTNIMLYMTIQIHWVLQPATAPSQMVAKCRMVAKYKGV